MLAGEFENDFPMLPFGEHGKKHRKDFITLSTCRSATIEYKHSQF